MSPLVHCWKHGLVYLLYVYKLLWLLACDCACSFGLSTRLYEALLCATCRFQTGSEQEAVFPWYTATFARGVSSFLSIVFFAHWPLFYRNAKKEIFALTSGAGIGIISLAIENRSLCGRGGIGRRVRLRGVWETV